MEQLPILQQQLELAANSFQGQRKSRYQQEFLHNQGIRGHQGHKHAQVAPSASRRPSTSSNRDSEGQEMDYSFSKPQDVNHHSGDDKGQQESWSADNKGAWSV